MAEIVLTPGQRAAVESRGCALLVAAAAGSGKTRVLIDRVLDQVIREGRCVDEFLLITFTQAAAAELRGKLLAELNRRLAADPENRHLQRQLSRVYLAQISTVHSFCAALLRDYAHVLELPADFKAYGLAPEHYDFIVRNCRSGSMKCNPRDLSDDDVRRILEELS